MMSELEQVQPKAPPERPSALNMFTVSPRDRFLAAGTVIWCFLAVDTVLYAWPWGMGFTAAVWGWYVLLGAVVGRDLFRTWESRILLVVNLFLGASFALGSNPYFRGWNFLALLALVPIHTMSLSAAAHLPWQRPLMLWERLCLLFAGLFCHMGAVFAALAPRKEKEGEGHIAAAVAGSFAALGLVAFLLPVLSSADALFAGAARGLTVFLQLHLAQGVWELFAAVMITPFLFGLLYSITRPKERKPLAAEAPALDGVLFAIILAALDILYLLFLLVQSAGLFGGPEYLAQKGISYADWARSGFFQMTGVSALNLTAALAAAVCSRKTGGGWRAVRLLAVVLAGESLVLLASAAWRMTLYISAYGLSFKRCMTYWGMAMTALFLLAALEKVLRPERSFCRRAFPLALAGWLVINCIPLDYLTAKNQADRYLSGESPSISAEYLLWELSYDTLSQLERVDPDLICRYRGGQAYLEKLLSLRREEAREDCSDWRTWNLSACLAVAGQ